MFQAEITSPKVRAGGDSAEYQVGVVLGGQVGVQPHGQELVTYFGSSLSCEQKQYFNTLQVVRQEVAGQVNVVAEDRYINMALRYLYRKGSLEVKHFMKESKIVKIAVEKEGVLLSSGRLLDEMNF